MAGAYEKVMDSRKELVEKVIQLMEEGYHNNHRAWTLQGFVPYNPESEVTYRGGNRLRLMIAGKEAGYKDSRWMTFRQIQKAGYHLKKDQHGILCEKWIFETKVKTQTEDGQEIEEIKELDRPKVSYFYVFNAEQVEGYPDLPVKEYEPNIMKIGDQLIKSSECPVYEVPQDSAYYNKSADHIVIPARYQFKDAKSFVATLVHEMGHSTGHSARLNRKFGMKFGDEDYAKEELRAELGTLFIESDLELDPSGEVLEDHSDYLLSWIGALRKDPNELFRACADAEKISERIVHNYRLYIQQENLVKNETIFQTATVSADEAAYHLDRESYLYVQTSEGGFDYTIFDRIFKEIDGGQLDNPSLNIEAARDEILALHEISPELIEQIPIEEYERLPELIGKEPTVTINFSESGELEEGTVLPFSKANSLFERLDRQTREYYGTDKYYDKTDFTIEYVADGRIHTYTGRQDLGDLDGLLADHIQKNATTCRNDPAYQEYLLKQGKEVQEETNAGYEDIIQNFVPYLNMHENLALMEQQANEAVKQMTQEKQGADTLMVEKLNYYEYESIIDYVQRSRIELNTGVVPQLRDMQQAQNNFKDDTEEYREQVEKEIEQEARDAGMTVEEYAANGYEPYPVLEVQPDVKTDNGLEPTEKSMESKDKDEKAADPFTTTPYYTIDESAARRAKAAYSMTDYKEGSATAEYRHYIDEAMELADRQKKKVDPMYHEKIDHLVDIYARKLAENMNHRFEIEARVPSILVAGGANFPVRQKEKQVAAEESNYREWKKIQGLLGKIRSTGTGGISVDDSEAIQKLETKLAVLQETQETMKSANAYYRKHETLDGCPGLKPEQIASLKEDMSRGICDKPFPSSRLSNNNAEIRRVKQRIESLKHHQETDYHGWKFDGGKVIANKEANRLQIQFDEKPSADLRSKLKSNGFRWSPRENAWQRQLNQNAYYAADSVQDIQPLTGEKPSQLRRKCSIEPEKTQKILAGKRKTMGL